MKNSPTPNLGVAVEGLDAESAMLNKLVADESALYTKTRNYHWNIIGPDFIALHLLLEVQYEQLADFTDDVAERVRTLGGNAIGTMREFQQTTRLPEFPAEYPPAPMMIRGLLLDHETMIRQIRSDAADCLAMYSDTGTNNFLIDLMNKHEKMAWKLRAHIAN